LRRFGFEWSRVLPTSLVALVILAVVMGGLVLDSAIAAPSAGTVTVGGRVTVTAAPGWVLDSSANSGSGIELRKANAALTAEVASTSYDGTSAALLADQRPALDAEATQISYGDVTATAINGHDTSSVVFQATVVSTHTGVIDGELICMVVDGNAVVIVVVAQQGDLDSMIDDVTAMLRSVTAAR
jgi:hypothetical protein